MNQGPRAVWMIGAIFIAMAASVIGPAIEWAATRSPLADVPSGLGSLLAHILPAGPITESTNQSFSNNEFAWLAIARWIPGDGFVRWVVQWALHVGVCAAGLWFWSRFGNPARATDEHSRGKFARSHFRVVAIAAAWAILVQLIGAEIRIVLASWHNETLGHTWQIYGGPVFASSRFNLFFASALFALYLWGVLVIAKKEVRRALPTPTDIVQLESCPNCGYTAAGTVLCPECGCATDGSVVRALSLGTSESELRYFWFVRIAQALALIAIVAGICEPLTRGVVWVIRQRMGM